MQKRFGDNLSPVVKYWIFLIGIILAIFTVIFGSFVASYLNLPPEDQPLAEQLFAKLLPFPFLGSLLLVVIICSLVSLIFQYYIIPVLRLAEQTRLITAANPEHRITTRGARELRILAEVINESAEAYQALQAEVDAKVQTANLTLRQERNRFAALMSQLPYGVLVCNRDGTILLYNREAQQMLEKQEPGEPPEARLGGVVGLGRSVFGLLDREPIVHMLEVMNQAHAHGQLMPAPGLMTKLCGRRFLRVNMAAITDPDQDPFDINGFVLSLEDISAEVDADNQRDRQLQELIDAVQLSMGQIQSGVGAICSMPGAGGEACERHRHTLHQVSRDLENHLALAREFYTHHRQGYGTRENVLAGTLLDILARNLKERFQLAVESQVEQSCWLKIDSYSFVQLITQLAGQLRAESRIDRLALRVGATDQIARLSLSWPGTRIASRVVADWQVSPLFMDRSGTKDSPHTIVARHGGALHLDEPEPGFCSGVHLTLPLALTETGAELPSLVQPRPISYEFDLFHQPVHRELAEVPLSRLTFVAFDTETTGLDPSQGDEIVQIGAVRIVNGRLQPNEVVDQLVNPQRHVPLSSVKIHGIQPELLDAQPTIEQVLPQFHRFVKGAVLVAHNAAFDMRFLQLKQQSTGLRFDNPVLDTLLLSSLVHPNQHGHSLDEVALRFNVRVAGRHTAFGDALVTAEVLLKLLPLLEAQGIVTLQDALQASASSRFVRLKY